MPKATRLSRSNLFHQRGRKTNENKESEDRIMQKRQHFAGALVVIGLALAMTSNGADQYGRTESKHIGLTNDLAKASDIIGKDVRNAQDEHLGKVQDLIVSLDAGSVPYAVIAHGGALGIGRTKTAVPVNALQCSADGKKVMLSATKEELKAASKTPPDSFVFASNAEWAKDIDGYFGHPMFPEGRYERQRVGQPTEGRQYVREPSVRASVHDGVVTLTGEVMNDQQKRDIEAKLKTVAGITRVDNQLTSKNP
jgi:sporulation protein YlmC with PRC-barrel domain